MRVSCKYGPNGACKGSFVRGVDWKLHLLHLVADVQLGGVEEQQDEVAACCEPATDLDEVVRPLPAAAHHISAPKPHSDPRKDSRSVLTLVYIVLKCRGLGFTWVFG